MAAGPAVDGLAWVPRAGDLEVAERLLRRTGVPRSGRRHRHHHFLRGQAPRRAEGGPVRARPHARRLRLADELGPGIDRRDPHRRRRRGDIGVFIEGWFTELFLGGFYDAELEKTHAYALVILLPPVFFCSGTTSLHSSSGAPSFGSSPTGRSRFALVPRGPRYWSTSSLTSPPTERRSSSSRRRAQPRWSFRSSGCSPARTASACRPEPARNSFAAG